MTSTFDPRPLTDPVDRRAVAEFARSVTQTTTAGTAIVWIVGGIMAVVGVAMVFSFSAVLAVALSHDGHLSTTAFLPIAVVVIVIVGITMLIIGSARKRRETQYRLHRFATANHMSYVPNVVDPPLPGMLFHIGRSRSASDLVRGEQPRFVEFGNYQYTTGSGKNSTTHHWGYVAVKLDVPLPNIVLDAAGNNSLFGSNLPARFEKEQQLSLEGDFDQHFALYCPQGYERDALYLFTPDIMARFIDHAGELDVEIIDDWMFLYSKRKLSTLDPATWGWLFGAVGALMTKFDQWARWRDERLVAEQGPDAAASAVHSPAARPVAALPFAPPAGLLTPPPGVAPQGRRLRRKVQWVPILFAIAIGIFWIWMQTR